MIKQNELRLGNWFYDGFTNKEGKLIPAIVRQILEEVREDEFAEPIPLTPDILEKAGFKMYMTNPRLESFFVNVSSYYPFHIFSDRDDRYYFNEHVEIKNLHQLQNLYFALTGEELEIDLTR